MSLIAFVIGVITVVVVVYPDSLSFGDKIYKYNNSDANNVMLLRLQLDQGNDVVDWIEIFNAFQWPVDMSEWSLYNGEDEFRFPRNTWIEPTKSIVICRDIDSFKRAFDENRYDEPEFWGMRMRTRTSRWLGLRDKEGKEVDYVGWGGERGWWIDVEGTNGGLFRNNRRQQKTSSSKDWRVIKKGKLEPKRELVVKRGQKKFHEKKPNVSGTICPNLRGKKARKCVKDNYSPKMTLSYRDVRLYVYNDLFNNNGVLESVYCDFSVRVPRGGFNRPADAEPINLEHIVPQSFFDSREPMKTDAHHLFPAHGMSNRYRGTLKFGEVNSPCRYCKHSGCYDEYTAGASKTAAKKWSPLKMKGAIARAIAYFFSIYGDDGRLHRGLKDVIDEREMIQWHRGDPATAVDVERSRKIREFQGNDNPFVLDSTLMERVYDDIV